MRCDREHQWPGPELIEVHSIVPTQLSLRQCIDRLDEVREELFVQSTVISSRLQYCYILANPANGVKPKSGVVGPRDQSARSRQPDGWHEVHDNESEPERKVMSFGNDRSSYAFEHPGNS